MAQQTKARRGTREYTQAALAWANPGPPPKPSEAPTPTGKPDDGALFYIDLEKIRANIENPREIFDVAELEGLTQSIRVHGVLQPLTVRYAPSNLGTSYELIDGERRWRAAKLAGLDRVPVMVKSAENKFQQLVLSLVANVQTARLTPWEEAKALGEIQQTLGLTTSGLVELVGKGKEDTLLNTDGKGKGWVENRLAAFALPPYLRDVLIERPDALTSLITINRRIKDQKLQQRIVQRVRAGEPLSAIKKLVDEYAPVQKKTQTEEAPAPVVTPQGVGWKSGGKTEVQPAPEPTPEDIRHHEEFWESFDKENAQVLDAPTGLEGAEKRNQEARTRLNWAEANDRRLQATGRGADIIAAPSPERVAMEALAAVVASWQAGRLEDSEALRQARQTLEE